MCNKRPVGSSLSAFSLEIVLSMRGCATIMELASTLSPLPTLSAPLA
jgi:hypothetical protein